MSITRSIKFYCGKRNIKKCNIFGGTIFVHEFRLDIAYKENITYNDAASQLQNYMKNHNIKIGYCDISCDFGAGYSLLKRYTYINRNGKYITRKLRYEI